MSYCLLWPSANDPGNWCAGEIKIFRYKKYIKSSNTRKIKDLLQLTVDNETQYAIKFYFF